jgi:uncharacterized protein (TIGR00288 family)
MNSHPEECASQGHAEDPRGTREHVGKEERKAMQERLNIAVFVDFDNIEIGVKSTLRREFDVSVALNALKERGDIVSKLAYANWGRCEAATRSMAENAVQMVQRIPSPRGDKNGADINLALDALEMAFTHSNVTAFAIVSGDSDFIPLVNKLKSYGKTVFVVGGKAFTSTILQQNCHEFISYESLLDDEAPQHRSSRGAQHPQQQQQPSQRPPRQKPAPLDLAQAMPLVERALQVLERRSVQPQLGLLKSTMLQLDSRFSERAYGAGSFSDFVEKMRNAGYIELSGSEGRYLIRRKPSAEPETPVVDPAEALSMLRDVLETHRIEMDSGVLADDLAAWVREVNPQFDPTHYGFQEFAELLNFAQDKLLVRIEPDEEKGLLVHLGAEFYPPALPEEPPAPAEEEAPADEPQPIVEGQPTAIPVDEPPKPRKKATRRKAGSKAGSSTAAKRTPRPRRKKAPVHIGPMV